MIGGEHGDEMDMAQTVTWRKLKKAFLAWTTEIKKSSKSCLPGTSHEAFCHRRAYHHGLGVIIKAVLIKAERTWTRDSMPICHGLRLLSEASSPRGGFNMPQRRLLTPRTRPLAPIIVIRSYPGEQLPCICDPAPALGDV